MGDTSRNPHHRRIAIFVEHLRSGGAEKVAVSVANGLAARGYTVDMVMWRGGGVNLKDLAQNVGVVDFTEGGARKSGFFSGVSQLVKYHKRCRPAAVFSHLEKPSIVAVIADLLVGARVTIPCIHIDLIAYAKINNPLRRSILNGAVMMLYPMAPGIIAVSRGAAESARRLLSFFKRPVQVIYNGFDLSALRSLSVRHVAEPWLTDKTMPVIVACGRLTQQKAYDVLIPAFADLRRQIPARLVILGEGPEYGQLHKLVETLGIGGDVMIPGFVADPISWFSKCDLFVLASRCEALPTVLIEALVAGVPVVSTDCPSGPQEILEGGCFGELVPVDDRAALTAAMSRSIQTKPALDQTALAEHLEKFSRSRMFDDYEAMIETCGRAPAAKVQVA